MTWLKELWVHVVLILVYTIMTALIGCLLMVVGCACIAGAPVIAFRHVARTAECYETVGKGD